MRRSTAATTPRCTRRHAGRRPRLAWYAERTAPYPLTIDERDVAALGRLYEAIAQGHLARRRALPAGRAAAARCIALPPPFVELLRTGRPPALPARGAATRLPARRRRCSRVCEVNARFPTNGFLCSYYTNQVVEGLDHLAGRPARAVPGLRRTLDALASPFEPGPLVVLLDRGGRDRDLPPDRGAAAARHRRPRAGRPPTYVSSGAASSTAPNPSSSSSWNSSATSCWTSPSGCSTRSPPARAPSTTCAR